MANVKDYDYSKIEQPYDNFLNRGEVLNPIKTVEHPITAEEIGSRESETETPQQIKDGKQLSDIWLDSWIKSSNYKPESTGFNIDGKRGTISGVKVYGAGVFTISGAVAVATTAAPSLIATTDLWIMEIYGYIRTAPTGADMTIDIDKNGTSILGATLLTIAAGSNTGSRLPLTGDIITKLAKNDRLDIDIVTVGSTIAGSDLSVFVRVIQLT